MCWFVSEVGVTKAWWWEGGLQESESEREKVCYYARHVYAFNLKVMLHSIKVDHTSSCLCCRTV